MPHTELIADIFAAFAQEAQAVPALTLRAGDELDAGRAAIAHDLIADAVSDAYLEAHAWGSGWLDAASWRHYLPFMMAYALRRRAEASEVIDAVLTSLRPPDRDPPRLGSLSQPQETAVLRFLDVLACSADSANMDLATQVLNEWWTPGAIPREADE
jgi:hypothetical protein